MSNVKELLQERGELEHEMRTVLDAAEGENRDLTSEEDVKFKEMHERDMSLRSRIERQEKLDAVKSELDETRNHGIDRNKTPASAVGDMPEDRNTVTATEEDRCVAFQAWCLRQAGEPLRQEHDDACERVKLNPNRRTLAIPTMETRDLQQLQNDYRNVHPTHWGRLQRNVGTGGGSAGSIVPQGFVNNLEMALLAHGGMLQVAEIITTNSGNDLPWPTANDSNNIGEQLNEAGSIGSSVDPTFSAVTLQAFKFSSKLIKVSTEIMQDSAFDLAARLGEMLGTRIARILNLRFTTGTGSSQPNGLVTAATVGVTAATSNAIIAEELIELIHSVDPSYRNDPSTGFMMHDNTVLAIRKLKDSDGQFLWQSGLQQGVPDRLLSYSLTINQDMDAIDDVGDPTDASEDVILFGQLNKYKIRLVREIRMRHLVERFADTDEDGFVGFRRADGDLLDAGVAPVKKLRMAA